MTILYLSKEEAKKKISTYFSEFPGFETEMSQLENSRSMNVKPGAAVIKKRIIYIFLLFRASSKRH